MADQITPAPLRALDANGNPVPEALLSFFQSGTTTPVTVYQDTAGTIPHATPIEADEDGVWPEVYDISGLALKAVATTPALAALPGFPLDPCVRNPLAASAASSISFTPTTDIPYNNTQEAIEGVYADVLEQVGQRVIAQGSLTGAEIIVEIPEDIEGIQIEYWRYVPSSSGQQLKLQAGSGTIGSPTWGTGHLQQGFSLLTLTPSYYNDTAASFVALSVAVTTGSGNGDATLSGFHVTGQLQGMARGRGIVTGPARQYFNGSITEEANVTHTLIRLFVSSGTMAGGYRIIGFRKP